MKSLLTTLEGTLSMWVSGAPASFPGFLRPPAPTAK